MTFSIYGRANQACYVRDLLAGCASQWYSANVEENFQKFSKMDAFPPEYQGPTWLNWRF